MQDVSGFGSTIRIIASATFPVGIDVTAFADDVDAFDIPSVKIADTAMGVNGDLVAWSRATPLKLTVAVIEGSDDDKNLAVLLENNRVGRGKIAIKDVITLTVGYPDGRIASFTGGVITDGLPAASLSSSGKLKSKPYAFSFENRINT